MREDLVFDVGMNNGDDTAYYLHRGFRVVAIEADPTLADAGRQRFADAIRDRRLEVVNAAIGPRQEVADFWVCEQHREWNSFDRAIASRNGLPHYAIPVQCYPFRHFLQEYGTPFHLKVDIEGHDHYCLEDLDAADLPRYVSFEMSALETLLTLHRLGYTGFKLITQNDHSQLVVDVFSTREVVRRALRPHPWLYRFASKLARAGRGVSDGPGMRGSDRHGWHFPIGSSGPFGEETDGEWHTLETAAFTWTAYQLGQSVYGPPVLDIWHDIHARHPG